jgi:subfamily B ATP-binding cassette protein MsbA
MVIFSLMQPIKEISTVNNRIQEAIAAGQRVFSLIDTDPEIKERPGALPVQGFNENILYRNVSFSYNGSDSVLKDIDINVTKGEVLAIVGPSGAGKSTLVDMLPRFYDPQTGHLEIDGQDVRDLKIGDLRALLGIVTQETILFNDTVRNNIAYGMSDTPLEKIISAAKAANAHHFIMKMEKEYDTPIGERGVKVSGGERQRLAIARAILKDPPILILDEATSSLDTQSELLVQEAMERLMKNRTSFVIAHRLSTILHADKIIVMEKGRIVERGTHRELLKRRGLYKHLYDIQFRDGLEAGS